MNERVDPNTTFDEDTLIAYALGMLEEVETEAVEHLLMTDPERLTRLRGHLEALTLLALSDEPTELPGHAETDLLNRIRGVADGPSRGAEHGKARESEPQDEDKEDRAETRRSAPGPIITVPTPRRGQPWLALVAALALLALGFGLLTPVATDAWVAYQLRRYSAQGGTATETLVAEDGGRLGVLIRLQDDRVVVAMDTAPPDERVYQAWEIADGSAPMSRGIWTSRLFTSEPLSDGNLFGISVEPTGGSPQPTSTPIVVLPL